MKLMTYRELQLLKAFRAADDRGKHAIERLANLQAGYGNKTQTGQQRDNIFQLRRRPS